MRGGALCDGPADQGRARAQGVHPREEDRDAPGKYYSANTCIPTPPVDGWSMAEWATERSLIPTPSLFSQYTTPALFVAKAKLERQVIKLDKDVLELQGATSTRLPFRPSTLLEPRPHHSPTFYSPRLVSVRTLLCLLPTTHPPSTWHHPPDRPPRIQSPGRGEEAPAAR